MPDHLGLISVWRRRFGSDGGVFPQRSEGSIAPLVQGGQTGFSPAGMYAFASGYRNTGMNPALLALQHYDHPSRMTGKIHALLTRRYPKGRDWYDLLWYRGLRSPPEAI